MAKNNKNKTAKKQAGKKPAEKPATVETPIEKVDETPIEEVVAEEMPASDAQASNKPASEPAPAPKEKPKAEKAPTPDKEEKPAQKADKKEEAHKPKVETAKPILKQTVAEEQFKSIADGLGKLADGERLSPDSLTTLANLVSTNYKNNPSCPPELQNAMSQSCDMMIISLTMKFCKQLQNDMSEVGIKVNNTVFDNMSRGFAEYFGTRLIGLPTPDGQTMLDFKGTMENAPKEVQDAIEVEAKVVAPEEIPAFVSGKSEDEYLKDIRSILGMKNGMSGNVTNALTYARKAFNLKDAEPAQVLATIITKLGDDKPSSFMVGCARAAYGTMQSLQTPFGPHSWVRAKLFPTFDDASIANVTRVLLSYGMKINSSKSGSDYDKSYLAPWSKLLMACDDNLIERIVTNGSSEKLEDIEMLVDGKPFSIEGLSIDKIKPISVINYIKMAYGNAMSDSLIKDKMKSIAALYNIPISPLSAYVEKSTYASK